MLATYALQALSRCCSPPRRVPVNSQCLQNSASLPCENGGEGRQVVTATRFSPSPRGECTYRSDVGYMGGTTEDEALFGQPIPPFPTNLGSVMARNGPCCRHQTELASIKRTVHDIWRPMHPKAHVVAAGFNRTARAWARTSFELQVHT